MNTEKWIEEQLVALRSNHLHRSLATLPSAGGIVHRQGRDFINFSSNDYLNFLHRPELIHAAQEATNTYGVGSGASRLVTGNLAIHEKLEEKLAHHKGYPAALLFGSGFLTNLGVVTALAGKNDVILADRLIHASLVDAARLSGAELIRFHHNDMNDLKTRLHGLKTSGRKMIISESVFSMDGDRAPIKDLAQLAGQYNAMLMIDEAHATGVFGPSGSGLIAAEKLQSSVNISMCTFSKALGGYGGIVACSHSMREWLINKSRSFIYTTALPAGVCGAAIAALNLLDFEPELGLQLLKRADLFRHELQRRGLNTGSSASQIIPLMVGENDTALKLAEHLREQGIIVTAIRPPTVPQGTARLRFSITLAHDEDILFRSAELVHQCMRKVGLA